MDMPLAASLRADLRMLQALEALLAPEFLLGGSGGQAFWWEGKLDVLLASQTHSFHLHCMFIRGTGVNGMAPADESWVCPNL